MSNPSNQRTSLAGREHFTSGTVPLRPTALSRALRLCLTVMSEGVRPMLRQPQPFKNAPDPTRPVATDRLAIMIDDVCDALRNDPTIDAERKLEQALALPRTIEHHIRSRLAAAPALSLKEHGLRVARTDATEDMTLAEHLANPADPSIALRAADMARHEAREKIGWADRVQALFTRPRSA